MIYIREILRQINFVEQKEMLMCELRTEKSKQPPAEAKHIRNASGKHNKQQVSNKHE